MVSSGEEANAALLRDAVFTALGRFDDRAAEHTGGTDGYRRSNGRTERPRSRDRQRRPSGNTVLYLVACCTRASDLAWKFSVQHVDQPNFPIHSQVPLF
jgi:hypothetical protein